MRKHLKLALMLTSTVAISFPSATFADHTLLWAQTAAMAMPPHKLDDFANRIVAVRDASGRVVYVNQQEVLPTSVPRPRRGAKPAQNIAALRPTPFQQSDAATATIELAITEAAFRHGMDPNLIRAVVRTESGFNPFAVSPKGALGLMQLMPATAAALHVANPFDPKENVDGGVRHLKNLIASFGGDLRLALAAYNAGEAAVRRQGRVPNFPETYDYLQRVTGGGAAAAGTKFGWAGWASEPAGNAQLRMYRDQRGILTLSNTD